MVQNGLALKNMQRSKRYYAVRKVARVTFWLLAAATIYFLATHINYTAEGYCFGSMDKCYLKEGK
jgi:hypothetical protein